MIASRAARRRLWLGLQTLFGVAERGYFIPHRYAGEAGAGLAGYPAAEQIFAAQRASFRAVLEGLDDLAPDLTRIGGEAAPAPRWDQDWFPRLDAAVAYALVRRARPRRILEVGSGHSTRFLLRALADGGQTGEVTAIDPAPRAALAEAGGDRLRLLCGTVQSVGLAPFQALAPGDVLSIDSSHVLMPGSDLDFLFGRVIPALPAGVHLHLHDIFLPDGYPEAWRWRGYNEQLAVLPLVTGGCWEVTFASRYVATRMADDLARSAVGCLPLPAGATETSLWLRRAEAAPALTMK